MISSSARMIWIKKKKAVYGDWMVVRGFRAYVNRATEAPLWKYFWWLVKTAKMDHNFIFFPLPNFFMFQARSCHSSWRRVSFCWMGPLIKGPVYQQVSALQSQVDVCEHNSTRESYMCDSVHPGAAGEHWLARGGRFANWLPFSPQYFDSLLHLPTPTPCT